MMLLCERTSVIAPVVHFSAYVVASWVDVLGHDL